MMSKFTHIADYNRRQDVLAAVLLFALIFLTYSNSLRNDFLIDDYQAVLGNPYVQDISFLGQHFIRPFANLQYRPLTYASLSILFQFFGYNPFGYHVVNLLFFYLSCLLVYQLLKGFLGDRVTALVTAVLFAVHPIQGMMINYVSATIFAFQVAAMSGSLIFLQKWIEQKRFAALMGSLFFFFLALLSHESAITLPLYVMAFLYYQKKFRWAEILCSVYPYGVLLGVYFLFRMSLLGVGKGLMQAQTIFSLSIPVYIAAFTKLIAWYIKCLVTLQGIVIIWVPQAASKPVWLWDCIFILLIAAFVGLTRWWGRNNPKTLAAWWFLIGFLPISIACILEPDKGITIRPHWLFFTNIGFFLLMAMFLGDIQKRMDRKVWFILIAGILAVLIVSSRIYNHLWGNPVRYNQYWLRESPMLNKHFLGDAYRTAGDFTAARDVYSQSFEENGSWESLVNVGAIDLQLGHVDSAMESFEKGVKLDSTNARMYTGLATAQQMKGLLPQAQASFEKSIELDPSSIPVRCSLAALYEIRSEDEKAITLYQRNLTDSPKDKVSLFRLMTLYLKLSQKERALTLAGQALDENRDDQFLFNIGSLLVRNGFPQVARPFYVKAIGINPLGKKAYVDLGKIYGNAEEWDQALEILERGLKMYPGDADFLRLIEGVRQLKEK